MSDTTITGLLAWEALDSRGKPTVGCEVRLDGGATGRATVPAGASTGRHEARELRDGGARYGGNGVRRAVANVTGEIAAARSARRHRRSQAPPRRSGPAAPSRAAAHACPTAPCARTGPTCRPHSRRVRPRSASARQGVPVHRVPIRQPLQSLQHHQRGHHRRRHRAPTPIGEQISEQLVGKQPIPFPRQEPVDRVLRQRLLTEPGRVVEQANLAISTPQRHREIPRPRPNRAIPRERHQPPSPSPQLPPGRYPNCLLAMTTAAAATAIVVARTDAIKEAPDEDAAGSRPAARRRSARGGAACQHGTTPGRELGLDGLLPVLDTPDRPAFRHARSLQPRR